MDELSYVTIISTDNYLIGALALSKSLKRVKSKYPLTIILSKNIDKSIDKILQQKDINYIRLTDTIEETKNNKDPEYLHWSNTFDKLFIFELIQFKKIVFIDSDMMIVNNIDHLFEMKHMSAVMSDRINDPTCCQLNSGLIVLEPQIGILNQMKGLIQDVSIKYQNFGDQDIIRLYFQDWKNSHELKLDNGYNMYYSDTKNFIQQGYSLSGAKKIYVIHFVGAKKPWNYSIKKVYRTLKCFNKYFLLKYLYFLYIQKISLFLAKKF